MLAIQAARPAERKAALVAQVTAMRADVADDLEWVESEVTGFGNFDDSFTADDIAVEIEEIGTVRNALALRLEDAKKLAQDMQALYNDAGDASSAADDLASEVEGAIEDCDVLIAAGKQQISGAKSSHPGGKAAKSIALNVQAQEPQLRRYRAVVTRHIRQVAIVEFDAAEGATTWDLGEAIADAIPADAWRSEDPSSCYVESMQPVEDVESASIGENTAVVVSSDDDGFGLIG